MTQMPDLLTDRSAIIGRGAIRALHAEVILYPKPGLVSPVDNGAHRDMDATTFLRSLFSLRSYFVSIARAGADSAGFPQLQRLGIGAEAAMMAATGGINTHRGAIFSLGLLAAAAGYMAARNRPLDAERVCLTVAQLWGVQILHAAPQAAASNGERAVRRYGAAGARAQAARGFPLLRQVVHPALAAAHRDHADHRLAHVQALFAAMAVLEDTNLLHRGGAEGLSFVQNAAGDFLCRGGVASPQWLARAEALHRDCIDRNLSPGGSADMLACAIFLHGLT